MAISDLATLLFLTRVGVCLYNSAMSVRLPRLIQSLFLLMACGAASGQVSAPPDKPQPRTLKAAEIPEELAYRIFFQELAAYQRKADELEAQGKNASLLRNRHQRLTALTNGEFRVLADQALPCAATLEANQQESIRLAQAMKQSFDKAGIQAQLIQLRRDNEAAVTISVGQLRAALGPQRFANLDLRVRIYVVSNLKIYSALQPKAALPEGN